MSVSGKIGYVILSLGVVLLGVGVSRVSAETITSPSYKIDGNFGGSFGGQTSSTSYKMTAIGGEAIVGAGSSGSYIIDQQQSSAAVQTMQLGVQPSGLVGYYPMDENTGTTTADASRYQNNGTFTSPAAWHGAGKIGSAVDINGRIDSVLGTGSVVTSDHANLPTGTQLTFEAWINPDDPSKARTIAGQWHDGENSSWVVMTNDNDVRVSVAPVLASTPISGYTATNGDVLSAGVWKHIVVIYDGTQSAQADKVKIYVNGVRAATDTGGTLPNSLLDSTSPFNIGSQKSASGTVSAFPGMIDHVKLFNRALSAGEIAAEYTAQNAGLETGFALGTETSESKVSLLDAIVRTNVSGYNLAIQQDHDLQNGVNTIPAISGGSIASPLTWSDGVTKGLGFTLMNAPSLDSKWASGASYAALPSIATTFYTNTGHVEGAVDVINARLRLDTDTPQVPGSYTNNITYTGTMIP